MASSSATQETGDYIQRTKRVWEEICGSFETQEDIDAFLDPNFVPEGWLDPPPKKKPKMSLKKASTSRFASVSVEKYTEAAKGMVPDNTKKNNVWAERTFHAWAEERNRKMPSDPVPSDLLSCHDPATVSKFLRYFVLEARNQTGEKYPPATIRSILSGLNRILKEAKAPFSILDKSNVHFRDLLLTMDSVTSELHREGIGVSKKSAAVISFEHENLFWETKVLSCDTPRSLQRAVFFSVGLRFALRGVQEHHDMKLDQLKRYPPDTTEYSEDTFYEYTEFISKNNQHRFKDINSVNKSVKVYAQPGSVRCVVRLLDFYISKLPQNPPGFYLRPQDKTPPDGKPCMVL